MLYILAICSAVLLLCVFLGKISGRLGVPSLLLFMVLGMCFGSDGLIKIPFDNFGMAESICSTALIFIMFSGGFETNWAAAKAASIQGILLSVFGVLMTAGITGLFCHYVLGMTLLEGMLIGSVVGSTDAASVFSLLRSKKLNLKNGLASVLEIESGSNDPVAYTMTLIILSFMSGGSSVPVISIFFKQLLFGLLAGVIISFIAVRILQRVRFESTGMRTIFVVAAALTAYTLPSFIGGNGYLSVYVAGIIMGNSKMVQKVELIQFFDSLSGLMQILLFFLLGLLAFPSQIPGILLTALLIAVFMSFVARPAAVYLIMKPFGRSFREIVFTSWAGLRGAASIVFAIMTVTNQADPQNDIFHIVFCIALLSVTFQGSFLPYVAKKLNLVYDEENVMKTFNDYQDDTDIVLIETIIDQQSPWKDKRINEVCLPSESLIVMIKREGNTIIPKGNTIICEGDILISNRIASRSSSDIPLVEVPVTSGHKWADKPLSQINLPKDSLIVMIKRNSEILIPGGNTKILTGDILVMNM